MSQDIGDDAKFSIDLVNFTGGAIDDSWTANDYSSAAGGIATHLLTPYATYMDSHHRFSKIDAYRMTFKADWVGSPLTEKRYPFNLTGAPEYTSVLNITGSGGVTGQAPQVAVSVTEIVPIRRSWGRFYLPFPYAGNTDPASNRILVTRVDAIATAVHTLYGALHTLELFPVVAITQSQKHRVASLEQVTNIRVDDVYDVIRRRRYQHALYKKTLPAVVMTTQPADEQLAAGAATQPP